MGNYKMYILLFKNTQFLSYGNNDIILNVWKMITINNPLIEFEIENNQLKFYIVAMH